MVKVRRFDRGRRNRCLELDDPKPSLLDWCEPVQEVLVAGLDRDFIYCSPLLPVQSLDGELADRHSPVHSYAAPGDGPDLVLLKKADQRRLRLWVRQLPAPLSVVARGLLKGETQAAMSRTLGISEPAVKKRLDRLARLGQRQLRDLRRSPLLA